MFAFGAFVSRKGGGGITDATLSSLAQRRCTEKARAIVHKELKTASCLESC
jgi:hypothetical protein